MCRMSAARVMLPASTIRTNENRRRVSMSDLPFSMRRRKHAAVSTRLPGGNTAVAKCEALSFRFCIAAVHTP